MEVAGIAVVTGASSGIGAATAVALAGRGAHVVAVARRVERLERTVGACEDAGGTAEVLVVDLSERVACERTVHHVEREHGRLDILVNNAGISMRRHAARLTGDDVERVMRVDFLGPAHLTLAALPGMLERGRGAIVNVTSLAGHIPNPQEAAYGAAKAALSRWTHTLAVDLAGTGVHVGEVSPGPIDTEIWEGEDEDEPIYEGKLYPPSAVARAVVRVIEHEHVHRTVPRTFGALPALYPLLQRPIRWGLRRFAEGADR